MLLISALLRFFKGLKMKTSNFSILVFFLFMIATKSIYASYRMFESVRPRTTKYPVINKSKFKAIVSKMGIEFSFLADQFDEKLLVYAGWNDSTFDQAMARRWDNAQVLVYRGLAHRKEIKQDALALIICHELGHLYGGKPLKKGRNHISVEGQADYFATNVCLKKALEIFDKQNIESRSLRAIKYVGMFLANNWGHAFPSVSTPDENEVNTTISDHPSPQCRFDTYMAGLKNEKRPRCWFADLD